MRSDADKKHWEKMYKSITDPEEREKAKQATDRKKRMEDRKRDTGL